MADNILSHICENSHHIHLENLENLYSKVTQSSAVLSMLVDFVCEGGNAFVTEESKNQLMQILFLLIDLSQDTERLLPKL